MGGAKFKSIKDATLNHIGDDLASVITSRYYKGADGNSDNVVIERITYDGD